MFAFQATNSGIPWRVLRKPSCWASLLLAIWVVCQPPASSFVWGETPVRARPRSAPVRDGERTFQQHVTSWTSLRKENVVMQQRDYSCGAASLATLIRYHWGDSVSETQLLREALQMLTAEEMQDRIKNGLSLTDLRRLAVRVGYQAAIGRQEFDKLAQVKIPLIVGIVVNGFNHFVIYRGTDGEFVYLADPARGNIRTLIPEFKQQWQQNAVLVVIKPGVNPERDSALHLSPWEKRLGETNRAHLRRHMTSALPPY
jgi:hypothetical protein